MVDTADPSREKLRRLSDDPSCKYSTKASCDGDPGCAWCLSGAVPPACNTLAEARALPPSVFKCDKVEGGA